MTNYRIKIYSKKKSSLTHFLRLIKQFQNQQIISNFTRKKKKRKKITILKSPHVNKKAQEQYQFVRYQNEFSYLTWNKKKSTIFIKKIKDNVFPDVKINIEQFQSINKKKIRVKENLLRPLRVPKIKTSFFSKKLQRNNKLFARENYHQEGTLKKNTLVNLKKLES